MAEHPYFTSSKVRASMTSNIETVVNPVDTPIDSTTRELATVEENRTLRHVMAQLWQAWANGQEPPTSILVPISNPLFPPGYGPFDNCGVEPSTTRPQGMPFRNNPTIATATLKLIDHGVVIVTNDQNTPNVTNNPLPGQKNLVGMICDDQEYKLLGQTGKLFRKIGEEDQSIKSLEPVASLSVEGVNLDSKVLCVPGVSKGIEVRAGMLKLYVSKGFSLTQHDQNCLAKLKGPIFVKSVQQLPVTDSKVVPWNYNKIVMVYRGKEIVEVVDEA
ncbi:hypothetical protein H5410_062321 [Solanum commersonii]|uniref:Uncharacterized protein n=1 Tax=Solanum commersonii TaxID=4109 RepID=A0A9J5WA28_SOLCO|nr:hypothetical protein H5410_062321 [Solanum commersonii]